MATLKAIARNDQLLWIALSYLLYSVANVATTGVLFYQFKYVLGAPNSFSIAGVIPVITGLVTTPLYPVLNRRIPRRWLYTAGMALMIAGYTLFIIAPMNLPVVIVALVLFYLPAQTIQMTAILSMTDSIEYGQLKTGKRNEAVTLSVRPMLDKIAGALSNGIVGFVVVAAGMVGNATAADMTAANIRTFKTCAYYLPLAGIVASLVVFLLTVKIDENMHDRIVDDKSASATARAEYEIFKGMPPAARVDRTWDNGTEASLHVLVDEALGMLTYFADPYGSWQRGSNENRNGRIRRYLPKGTSFEDLTQDELDAIVGEINDTPMKLLGYKTPNEVWDEEMAKLQSKQADPKPAVALTS